MKKTLMTVISLLLVICLMMPSAYAATDNQTSYDSVIDYVADVQANDEADSKIRFSRIINGLSNFVMSDAVESDNEDMLNLATETQINIGK